MRITKKVIRWIMNKTKEDIYFNFEDCKKDGDFIGYSLGDYVREQYRDELEQYIKEVLKDD